jgi:hypothetical protein
MEVQLKAGTLGAENNDFTRHTLQADSFVTGFFGVVFVFGASPVAVIFGLRSPGQSILAGIIFIAFSIYLALISGQETITRPFCLIAIACNAGLAWMAAYILLSESIFLSSIGQWSLMIIIGVSLFFIVIQAVGLFWILRNRSPEGLNKAHESD